MATVWKYNFGTRPMMYASTIFDIPKGSELLNFDYQEINGEFCLWVHVPNPKAKKVERKFQVIGTGWDTDRQANEYVGSCLVKKGINVWHCFEVTK